MNTDKQRLLCYPCLSVVHLWLNVLLLAFFYWFRLTNLAPKAPPAMLSRVVKTNSITSIWATAGTFCIILTISCTRGSIALLTSAGRPDNPPAAEIKAMDAAKTTMMMTNISTPVIHPRRNPDSRFRKWPVRRRYMRAAKNPAASQFRYGRKLSSVARTAIRKAILMAARLWKLSAGGGGAVSMGGAAGGTNSATLSGWGSGSMTSRCGLPHLWQKRESGGS